jgi:hypothetical protein
MHLSDIHSAAIDALGLVENPSAGQKQLLIIYLRYTGLSEISELVAVENAFVFSLEEAAAMVCFHAHIRHLILSLCSSSTNPCGRPSSWSSTADLKPKRVQLQTRHRLLFFGSFCLYFTHSLAAVWCAKSSIL